ncbi:hypothetical protein D1632_02580 [Chryseobacterium nematophagum]|uniref:SprT-like domain-containing protein n=1 Tax=Chryseobacterium nematophagum TaxID=2305228 RepID=A0A3M7LDQ3_9FLAO|nr:hypothetical protein [Chryseobacterium nematophagum]RMZ60878.1 hypothetical protein D1632_02580 [Chryseobacterium nematophagum]
MNFDQIKLHLNAYKSHDQIIDAAQYLIHSFNLEHENFAGFGFRDELSSTSLLLTAEGELGMPQKVMIPKNLFDFDLHLVLNMIAHEMLHVRQKAPGQIIEDKNEREFQAYYEMLFHRVFPQIPEVIDYYKKAFGNKALEYYKRMGEDSLLQKRYSTQKTDIENLINSLP